MLMRGLIPRQVDEKSGLPEEEEVEEEEEQEEEEEEVGDWGSWKRDRGLEFSKRRKGQTCFSLCIP